MNNNQLFDEHIKEQLGDYSPPVPARIWEQIAAAKDKKRPAGFWFRMLSRGNLFLLLGLLLAGGSGAWLWMQQSHKEDTAQAYQPKSGEVNSNKNQIEPTTTNNNTNDNSSNNIIPGNTTTSAADNNSSTAPATQQAVTKNSTIPFTDAYLGDPSLNSRNRNRNNTGANTLVKTTDGNLANVDTEEENADQDLPVGGTLLGRLTFIAEKIAAAKKGLADLRKRYPGDYLPDCPALERNAAGNKKYFEIYGGPDYAFQSLKDTGNSTYLQKRKESTKFSSAFSAGVRYTRVFNNSMSVRAGINYSQINEKFTYVQGNLVQVTYIIDANGDTTGSYITTGTRYKTTHNKYKSIDIPLMVGYEVGNGKLHANISAGPVINIYSWQKGEVLDTALQPVDITTGKGSSPYQFKTNAGIGFMGSVSVYYKLNDRIHIMAEPYYRHNFSQMNKENLTLKQKYNTVGLRLGLRIDLP